MHAASERSASREILNNPGGLARRGRLGALFQPLAPPEGRTLASWFQGKAEEFISLSGARFEKGMSILHFLKWQLHRRRERAIAQTKLTISQRGRLYAHAQGASLAQGRGFVNSA
jgi:hypothetical protein